MKLFIFIFSFVIFNQQSEWLTDFAQAQKISAEKKESLLLNFSGSDWCGPCIRMKQEIFDSEDFKKYANGHLVLVNADFPRNKKNKLSKELEKQNERLAEKYNPNGIFPYSILLNPEGTVIKEWPGNPEVDPVEFIQQIKKVNGEK